MTAENQGFLISSYYCASMRKKKKKTEESRERENDGEKGRKEGKMKPEAHFWVSSNALSSI